MHGRYPGKLLVVRSFKLKRLFDVAFAAVALIALAPLILVLAVCTVVFSGRPILFAQMRPGLRGQPFRIYKFRTMADSAETSAASDDERLTRFGRILRSASLDELPALWNVLKGDMSIIGPRPLLMEYLPMYTKEQARRHAVKPGVTGWAQVNGRNLLSWEERFTLDVWYVDNRTFWLDLRILWLTVKKVVSREGISHVGAATMPKFTGSAR